jgi:DNA-binding transcriptional LysR family regulator
MPPLGSIFRETVERALATLDLTSEAAMVESGSMTATNTYLRETHAIAFYSRHLASHYSSLGLLRLLPIAIPRLAHPIGAIWSGHAESIAMVVEYIDCLREVGAKVLEAPRSTD